MRPVHPAEIKALREKILAKEVLEQAEEDEEEQKRERHGKEEESAKGVMQGDIDSII